MSALVRSLGTTTPEEVATKIERLDLEWRGLAPIERRWRLIDAGMRLGWLAGQARTAAQVGLVESLAAWFGRLEARGL